MRLLSDDTSTSVPVRVASKAAYIPSDLDWADAKLSCKYEGAASPILLYDAIPPAPPNLPPVNMPSEGDGWLEITNGVGAKRSTWRVRVQPCPEDRALPVEEGTGFVRLGFDGISRQDLLGFLYAHSVDVEKIEEPIQHRNESALDRLDALYGEKQASSLLIPEVAVELPDYEPGRGRFAAAVYLEQVFLRFATSSNLEGDQPR